MTNSDSDDDDDDDDSNLVATTASISPFSSQLPPLFLFLLCSPHWSQAHYVAKDDFGLLIL